MAFQRVMSGTVGVGNACPRRGRQTISALEDSATRWLLAITEKLIHQDFKGPAHFSQRSDGRDCMAILNAGDITASLRFVTLPVRRPDFSLSPNLLSPK